MDRNTESHFSFVPTLNIPRSRFSMPFDHKTTYQVGELVPFFAEDVLPGDTIQLSMKSLTRLTPSVHPTMDNLYVDYYFFFVPLIDLWDHLKEFFGESNDPYIQPIDYEIPKVTAPSGGWSEGTIADYLGIPTKVENLRVNALYGRAYVKIWNDFFRDVNLQYAAAMNMGDADLTGSNGSDQVTDAQKFGKPLKVAKFHDYFTSALPQPLRGDAPGIGLTGFASVFPDDDADVSRSYPQDLLAWVDPKTGLAFKNTSSTTIPNAATLRADPADGYMFASQANTNLLLVPRTTPTETAYNNATGNSTTIHSLVPANLVADLSGVTSITITKLRQAIALQHYMERSARSGNRYVEYINAAFGVTSPAFALHRAQYLGGKRVPVNMSQVIQTSSTDSTSPQGNVTGLSLTHDIFNGGTHSFTEHGIVMGVMCARTDLTYQQGLRRKFTRTSKFDFYDPAFAALSEQPIFNREIYADGTDSDNLVFGYQEPWADYRYIPNQISGLFRDNATGSLSSWHYAQYYDSLPILGAEWIRQGKTEVDSTLAVSSTVSDPLIADILVDTVWTRPLPTYGIPGLNRI